MFFCLLFFFFLPLVILSANNNQKYIDSLQNQLLQSPTDSMRIIILNDLGWALKFDQPEQAKTYVKTASKLSDSLFDITRDYNYKIYSAKALNILGVIWDIQGQYGETLKNYKSVLSKAYEIDENADPDIVDLKNRLIASVSSNLGIVKIRLEEYESAIPHFETSIKYRRLTEDTSQIANAYSNMGLAFQNLEKYDTAIYFFKKAIAIDQANGNLAYVAYSLNNLSSVYAAINKHDSCYILAKKALAIQEEMDEKYGMIYSYIDLGSSSTSLGNLAEAEDWLLKGKNLAEEMGAFIELKQLYYELSQLYHAENNNDKAYDYMFKYSQMLDSLHNDEKQKEIGRLEAGFEYDKKLHEQKLEHEKNMAIEAEKQKRQQIIIVAAILGLILVAIFLVLMINRYRIIKFQKREIEDKNEELNQQNEEISAQRDQIESQNIILTEQKGEILASINYARRIQTAILPPRNMIDKHLSKSFVLYKPKDVVAGDFYWLEVREDIIFFAVADCTGHGVPGAMVSVVCHSALNRCVREYKLSHPAEILDKTRELVLKTFEKSEEQVKDGMDICLCAWNQKKGVLEYSGANNPLYVLKKNDDVAAEQQLEIIKADKQPIGYVQNIQPFTNHTVNLDNARAIYLFTDGYADQFGGAKNRKFGYKNLRALLSEISNKTTSEQKSILNLKFDEWVESGNDEQIDDVCIWGVIL